MGKQRRKVVHTLHFKQVAPDFVPTRAPSGSWRSGRASWRRQPRAPVEPRSRTLTFPTFEEALAEVAKYKLKLYDGPASDWMPTKIVTSERLRGTYQVLRIVELSP